ncbi:hypothetical protein LLL17_004299 [Salmonella enterica]|nr:hypothetical protein [Salmonella enterica]EIH1704433.1 hypothetical protein [Salmonella enterica]EIL4130165.1 hypothetical protein [Salmonella enterica]
MVDTKDFDNRVKLAVDNYTKSSKVFVTLLIEAVEIFNGNSQNAGKISVLVNKLAPFPRLQSAAKAISAELCPVQFVEDDKGNFTASVSKTYSNLVKDSKDEKRADQSDKIKELSTINERFKTRLAKYKERSYNSLLATRNYDEVEQPNYFKPVKIDKLESKISDLATNLIAVAMLSNPAMTREEVITKLVAKVNAVVDSEVEAAKALIVAKTPIKPAATIDDVKKALETTK